MNTTKFGLGKRIADKRNEKGLTQEKLAEILECTAVSISNWENGVTRPTDRNISRLACEFGCSEQSLLFGEDKCYNNESKRLATIDEMVISLCNILCISKEAANALFDACVWSGEFREIIENPNVELIAEKVCGYMRYSALEKKQSSVSNKVLLEKKKNDAKISLLKMLDKAAASYDSELVNRYKDIESDMLIDSALNASNVYDLLEQKRMELITDYLFKAGNDKGTLFGNDKSQLIGKYICLRSDNVEYSMTNDLRQYAARLFDEEIIPKVRDCLSAASIDNYKEIFLEGIDITSNRFEIGLCQ